MKVREAVKKLQADGWYYASSTGSHHHYKHPMKPGKVTVPGNPGIDLKIGTVIAIEKQSGVKLR